MASCAMLVLYFLHILRLSALPVFFFFNDTATTEIYTLSLHDALPISAPRFMCAKPRKAPRTSPRPCGTTGRVAAEQEDRKSTRLNSSHQIISYAVFCLKKKKNSQATTVSSPVVRSLIHPALP